MAGKGPITWSSAAAVPDHLQEEGRSGKTVRSIAAGLPAMDGISRRVFLGGTAALTAGACAPRGMVSFSGLEYADATPYTVHVATTRAPTESGLDFSNLRGTGTSRARFVVSVPPGHRPGRVDWPRDSTPDPRRHFVTRSAEPLEDAATFRHSIDRALAAMPPEQRDAIVYVHGFNVNFAESLYRNVQLTHDLGIPGKQVVFSWASAGNPLGYLHDRDSLHVDRDALETLIRDVATSRAQQVILLAHSMGAFLTMEALRQLAIAGDRRTLERIGGVVLLAPDIDVSVFRAQVARIGTLPQPFVVFVSRSDQALFLSARVARERDRLGSMPDATAVADLPVVVLDITDFGRQGGLNHNVVATSPALMSILRNALNYRDAFQDDQIARTGVLPGTVTLLDRATRIVLRPLGP